MVSVRPIDGKLPFYIHGVCIHGTDVNGNLLISSDGYKIGVQRLSLINALIDKECDFSRCRRSRGGRRGLHRMVGKDGDKRREDNEYQSEQETVSF